MKDPLGKLLRLALTAALTAGLADGRAWAAVIKVSVPAAGLSPSASAAGASFGPSASGLPGTFASSPGSLGVLPALPSVSAPAASPDAAPRISAAAAEVKAAVETPRARTQARAAEMIRAAAAELDAVRSEESSPAELHGASSRLEDVLTGEISSSRKYAGPVPGEESRRHASSHLSHDHFEISEAAPRPRVPAPEISPETAKRFRLYKTGVSAVKAGIETMHIAVPLLVLTVYGSAATVGGMVIGGNLASLAAGWLASSWVDKTGPAKVLAATAALQAVVIGLIPALYVAGVSFGFPVVAGLYITSGALSGVFDIARRAEMPHILGRDEGTLREYNGRLYIWREIAGIAGDVGSGLLAKTAGFLTALWLHPVSYAIATYNFVKLALMQGSSETRPGAPKGEKESLRAKASALFEGARIVLKDRYLRTAALINVPVLALHQLFHTMLAAVYATHVLGNPMLAAVMIAAWNLGELASAWWLKKHGKEAKSSFKWLKIAAVAGLSSWLLWAAPSIWVAAPVAFVIAATTLSNELGLASFFQARASEEDVGKVTGFIYSASTAVSMGVLYAMGVVFDAYGASFGFLTLSVSMSVVALLYYLSWLVLRRLPPSAGAYEPHSH